MPVPLHITLIQPDIIWEDKAANMQQYEEYFKKLPQQRHIVLLPEMCTTGFSMEPEKLAEDMSGPSVQWLRNMSKLYRCIIAGSFIIEEEGKYYNRLIWMQPNGQHYQYDKRHLFGYAGEHEHYTPGDQRLIVQVNGWRICPLVCYDLRFPVWGRNGMENGYDILLYLANWPQRRSLAWKTLLQARAIENQCYTIGLNRVGKDGKDIEYSGDSSVFGPLGETLWQQTGDAVMHTVTLSKEELDNTRQQFPFLQDADPFVLL